MSDYKVSPFQ